MSGQVGSNRKLTNAVPLDVSVMDGNGDQVTSFGGGSGGTAHSDDSAFAIGGASILTPVGYLADETAPDSVDEGDVGTPRMTLNRLALGVISDAASEVRANVVDLTTYNGLAVAVVDGNGDQVTSFGAGTQYTEDAAAVANPIGNAIILVREDARAGNLVSTDGDNVAARGNNKGELYVKHTDSIAVTNAGTFAVQEASLDAALIAQEATTSGVKGVTVFGAVTTNAPTYTNAKSDALSLDTTGLLRVSLKDTPANTNKLLVTPDLPTGASTAAKQPALGTAGAASTDVITIQGIAAMTKLLVTPDSVALPANQSVNISQVNAHTLVEGGVNGSQSVGGPTAAGATLAANPITIGGLAKTAPPTAVSTTQVVNALYNIYGEAIVRHCLRETKGNQQTSISSSTSETTVVTADATYKLDLYGLVITNTSATVCKVTIKDSTAGTTRFIFEVPATETRGFMVPASDGHKQAAANNNWTATCGTSVATIEITALFVQNL